MASNKKGKSNKNAVAGAHSNKNVSQKKQSVGSSIKKDTHEDAKQKKSASNPAKPPKQSNRNQSMISSKPKETTSLANLAAIPIGNTDAGNLALKSSNFLNEVLVEFRKISWPQRAQVIQETINVLFLVLLITGLVWGFDLVVGKFVFSPLEHFGHLYGIGSGH